MRQAGSIVKKRNRYYVVYRNPDKKQKWIGGFEKKAEAQTARTRILGEIQTGAYFETDATTFEQFADEWLENRVSIKGSTWQNYKSYLDLHVKPVLGSIKMSSVDFPAVQRLVRSLGTKKAQGKAGNLSANTIRKITTMLSTLFSAAMKQKLMRTNPAVGLELPKVVKAKIEPSTMEGVRAILEQAPADVRLLFQLDALTGLRRGEILALQWRDVDWMNSELVVERAISRARATDGVHKYQQVVGTTKGGRSRRVGLAPMLLEGLRHLRATTVDPSEGSFIFTRNGTFIDPEYFSKWIALPLVKSASKGSIKRFHDLRHFYASMLIAQGENPKYIQDQLGHASITTTFDIYGHLMPQARREASAKLAKSLFEETLSEKPSRTVLDQKAVEDLPQVIN